MKALILAAGRGSRMKGATKSKPKCLVRLEEKPLLHWQSSALKKAGIEDIFIVRGYRKHCFQNASYRYFDNPIWKISNMVESLYCADELLSHDTCIISYSDIVYHPSIVEELMKFDKGEISITYDRLWRNLWQERFENPLDDAETLKVSDGVLTEIGKKTQTFADIEGQYMGLLKITPEGWKKIKERVLEDNHELRKKLDMTSLLQRLLSNNIPIHALAVDGKWCEVDNEQDLHLYHHKIQQDKNWSHDWRSEL